MRPTEMPEAREWMKTKTKTTSLSRKSGGGNAITSLPPSPDEERRGRMIRYSLAMLVRLVCIIVAFLVPGWWALVPAIGAIVLPYVAVVLANVGQEGVRGQVERPGGLEVYRPQPAPAEPRASQAYFAQEPQPQSERPQARPQPQSGPRFDSGAEPESESESESNPETPPAYRPEASTPSTPRGPFRRQRREPRPYEAPRAGGAGEVQPPPR